MADAALAPPATAGAPDFGRRVYCLLGLPFDAIGLDDAVRRLRAAAFAGRRCVLVTPNLNWVVSARADPAFAETVLRSDLSVVDGMPLIWLARLLRLPLRERVSGADLFEALQAHAGPPLSVYLFGGPPGVAAAACERLNRAGGGLRCVGFDEGGFGSVESMSSDAHVERINRSGAHFVVVALGAAKGQRWIERNAARLSAPLISHLGAVLNFAAGTVRRAPAWMRGVGLEWLWRIRQEPALWRRYASDGARVLPLFLGRVVPQAWTTRVAPVPHAAPTLAIDEQPGRTTLSLAGTWTGDCDAALRAALARAVAGGDIVCLDLAKTEHLDAAVIGVLLVAAGALRAQRRFTLGAVGAGAARALHRSAAERLLAAAEHVAP